MTIQICKGLKAFLSPTFFFFVISSSHHFPPYCKKKTLFVCTNWVSHKKKKKKKEKKDQNLPLQEKRNVRREASSPCTPPQTPSHRAHGHGFFSVKHSSKLAADITKKSVNMEPFPFPINGRFEQNPPLPPHPHTLLL